MKTLRNFAILSALVLPAGLAMASNQPGTAVDQWFEQDNPTAPNHDFYSSTGFYPYTGSSIANANMTAGAGTLDTIGGSNTRTMAALNHNSCVSVYCVTVTDPLAFSVTCNQTPSNADLFLFKADGTAVAGYTSWGNSGFGPFPAATLAAGVAAGSFSPGDLAYIAITRDNTATEYNHPLNAAGQQIFPLFNGAVLPDPTVTDHVLATTENVGVNWSDTEPGGFGLFTQAYTLTLTGAGYSTLPAPGAGMLLGMAGLVGLRRRR